MLKNIVSLLLLLINFSTCAMEDFEENLGKLKTKMLNSVYYEETSSSVYTDYANKYPELEIEVIIKKLKELYRTQKYKNTRIINTIKALNVLSQKNGLSLREKKMIFTAYGFYQNDRIPYRENSVIILDSIYKDENSPKKDKERAFFYLSEILGSQSDKKPEDVPQVLCSQSDEKPQSIAQESHNDDDWGDWDNCETKSDHSKLSKSSWVDIKQSLEASPPESNNSANHEFDS